MAQIKDLIVLGAARILNKIYASEFIGKLTGNADTATKATQDESGNNIKSSYASSISISDHTITLKNKNGTSLGTVNVPDTNTWRGIQDNLTSTSTTDSLSANQGRILANGGARDNTKLPLSGGTLTGTLRIKCTTDDYCEGIRIQNPNSTWCTIALGGTSDTGTGTNVWSIHRKSDNNFSISRNSSDGANGLVMTSTGMGLGTTSPGERLEVVGNVKVSSNIYPKTDNSGNVGTSSNKWANMYATTFHGGLSGNATTATKLATARTIAITGSVTGSGTFDGSGNLSIATTTNHTHNYAGSSSAGGAATSAISVVDYGNTSKTIKIGYDGAGATTSNLTHIAGYLSGGTQIKDVSKDTLKSWLGLGSAAYTNSNAYAASSHTHTKSQITDFPTSLPANGGNADTVDGKHASNFFNYIGTVSNLFAVNQTCVCRYDANTLNTPYKAGHTGSTVGLCFVNCEAGTPWVSYLVTPCGDPNYFVATTSNGNLTTSWRKINENGNYLPLSGGTMTNNIYFGSSQLYIGPGGNDGANGVGGALNNIAIASWYGVSFTGTYGTYVGKTAVGIDCRNSIVYADKFIGSAIECVSGNVGTSAVTLSYKTGRTKVILLGYSASTHYSGGAYHTISSSMAAIPNKILVNLGNSDLKYAISSSGVITLTPSSNSVAGAKYIAIYFN